jgi:hypothetical protein
MFVPWMAALLVAAQDPAELTRTAVAVWSFAEPADTHPLTLTGDARAGVALEGEELQEARRRSR